ncbi:signal peptide peptidase SppA [Nisaea nitritireducens]|uniref:signal peptide peptidase SppA n=1 Tax=Nisaea nitritireducens TaxID=568392 RepID=UPI0018685461|nr:signal peptide peptidase SppA [Nisaea nitritireducens]
MLRFLKGLLISFGVLFLVLIVGAVVGLRYVANQWQPEPLPEHMVLSLTLKPELRETSGTFPFENVFNTGSPSLLDLVNTLKAASEDERVQGLFLDLSAAQVHPAEAQELRAAISRFRASGRFVQAYADSLEGNGGISAYHLATGAESIALQPSGLLDIRGISLTTPFFGEALEKLGIEADFRTRHEYKGAAASMTNAAFPAPVRQNYRRLVDSLYAGIAADIATARRLSPSSVNGLIDTAPLTAGEAKSNGLIDQLLYRDEAIDAAQAKAGRARLVPLTRYSNDADTDAPPTRIAVIAVDGPIVRGRTSLFARDRQAAAQNIVDAVEDARKDQRVKAIILRVSSPGGSYVASDTILHALSAARSGGLPVIVSMSDMAASGGYFVALAADHVVAHPNTITGSIGVVSGKLNLSGFLAEYGIRTDSVSAGRNADMFSMTKPFSAAESARLDAVLDTIYEDFTTKVAAARRLGPAEIDAAARGRVWSGEDAKRIGLVDVLGGYAEAEGLARDAAGIAPETRTALVAYPEPRQDLEAFVTAIEEGEIGETASRLDTLLTFMRYSGIIESVLNSTGGGRIDATARSINVR